MRKKIGVLGLGWWGLKLARALTAQQGLGPGLVIGVDPLTPRRSEAEKTLGIGTVEDPRRIFDDEDIEAVVVATPPPTHFGLAQAALAAGKHVLVTKPPTSTLDELEILVREAETRRAVFMLDSTFVYSDPVQKIRELLDAGAVPDIRFVQSLRYGNDLRFHHVGRLRGTMLANGVDVVRDLVFHDLAVITHLFPGMRIRPTAVHKANTLAKFTAPEYAGTMCDTAFLRLETDRFPIHIGLSWVLPERRRELLIASSDVQLVYDDLKPEKKISMFRIEDKHEEFVVHGQREPLALVVEHFLDCIKNGKRPMTDGKYMLDVMRLYDEIRECR
ncbi:MAG: Gfo/Idh/MocA family oxidoreductase [Candidatus Aminicenantales bacterium]